MAYDSQETLAVDKLNSCIQVRAPRKLIQDRLSVEAKSLEDGTLLFLRKVKTVTESYADSNDRNIVVYFDVIGAVEPLPKSTRYYTNLMNRLNEKAQKELEALQVSAIESIPPIEQPLPPQYTKTQHQPTQIVSPQKSLKESAAAPVEEPFSKAGPSNQLRQQQNSHEAKSKSSSSSKQTAPSSTTSPKQKTPLEVEQTSSKTRLPKQLLATPEKNRKEPSPKFQTPPEQTSPPRSRLVSSKKYTFTRYDTSQSSTSSEMIIVPPSPSPSRNHPKDPTPEIFEDSSEATSNLSLRRVTKPNSGNGCGKHLQ